METYVFEVTLQSKYHRRPSINQENLVPFIFLGESMANNYFFMKFNTCMESCNQ